MQVVKYTNKLQEDWDQFILGSKNGTLFHSRRFLNYHPRERFEDRSLIFKKKNKIISVFPAAVIKTKDQTILKSHPGSSYGGPVFAKNDGGINAVIDVTNNIINWAAEENFDLIEMRLSPRVFHLYPSEELEYVLSHTGFEIISTELSSAVQLMFENENSLYDRFRYNTKQPAKKAVEKGVVFEETEDYGTFWRMLEVNLIKHGAKPTHSLNELLKLKTLLVNDMRLFGAYYEGKMIAGTLLFQCNSVVCHTFYIAQDYDYQKLRPLNILLIETVKWAQRHGFRYLNFGISTEASGTIVNPGLFRFKEGFGASGSVRRYYRKNLMNDEI